MMSDIHVAHKLDAKLRTLDVSINEQATFSSLLISESVLTGLTAAGFERLSPIQLKAIPLGRCGFDLVVQAKSGTGKTCVFAVIALESIDLNVIVLSPTREIAVQNWEVICSIGQNIPDLRCYAFIGGLPVSDDLQKLKKCHIAVATPGRLKQLIENSAFSTQSVRMFVLDEADKLMDDSFQDVINWVYSTLPSSKQMLALSATYPKALAAHVMKYMMDPVCVRLCDTNLALLGMREHYIRVPFHPVVFKTWEYKMKEILKLLSAIEFRQCLIFSNFQMRAQSLSDQLSSSGWPCCYINSGQDQQSRLAAMARLKQFKCRVLVSTDLTSRGIDAENVNLVINIDVPHDHETYLHRIGRAGRFGTYGLAVTIVSEGAEFNEMKKIEEECNTSITELPATRMLSLHFKEGLVELITDPCPADLILTIEREATNSLVQTERLKTPADIQKNTSQKTTTSSEDISRIVSAESKSLNGKIKPKLSQSAIDAIRSDGDIQNHIPAVNSVLSDGNTDGLENVFSASDKNLSSENHEILNGSVCNSVSDVQSIEGLESKLTNSSRLHVRGTGLKDYCTRAEKLSSARQKPDIKELSALLSNKTVIDIAPKYASFNELLTDYQEFVSPKVADASAVNDEEKPTRHAVKQTEERSDSDNVCVEKVKEMLQYMDYEYSTKHPYSATLLTDVSSQQDIVHVSGSGAVKQSNELLIHEADGRDEAEMKSKVVTQCASDCVTTRDWRVYTTDELLQIRDACTLYSVNKEIIERVRQLGIKCNVKRKVGKASRSDTTLYNGKNKTGLDEVTAASTVTNVVNKRIGESAERLVCDNTQNNDIECESAQYGKSENESKSDEVKESGELVDKINNYNTMCVTTERENEGLGQDYVKRLQAVHADNEDYENDEYYDENYDYYDDNEEYYDNDGYYNEDQDYYDENYDNYCDNANGRYNYGGKTSKNAGDKNNQQFSVQKQQRAQYNSVKAHKSKRYNEAKAATSKYKERRRGTTSTSSNIQQDFCYTFQNHGVFGGHCVSDSAYSSSAHNISRYSGCHSSEWRHNTSCCMSNRSSCMSHKSPCRSHPCYSASKCLQTNCHHSCVHQRNGVWNDCGRCNSGVNNGNHNDATDERSCNHGSKYASCNSAEFHRNNESVKDGCKQGQSNNLANKYIDSLMYFYEGIYKALKEDLQITD